MSEQQAESSPPEQSEVQEQPPKKEAPSEEKPATEEGPKESGDASAKDVRINQFATSYQIYLLILNFRSEIKQVSVISCEE